MTRKRSVASATALAAVAALVAAGAIYASSGDDGKSQGANQIIGSWELTVDRGPQLPPVKGLTTYTRGHSVVGTANLLNRGPAHGTWKHLSGRLYADTHVFFRFDPATGAFQARRESTRPRSWCPTATRTRRLRSRICSIRAGTSSPADCERRSPRRGSTSTGSRISRRPIFLGLGASATRRPGPAAWSPALPGELERQEPTRPVSRTPARRTRGQ